MASCVRSRRFGLLAQRVRRLAHPRHEVSNRSWRSSRKRRRPELERITHFVTRVRKSADALREQANLLDLTHDAIFVRDMQNVITYWNRGAEQFYGWTSEELIGKATTHQLLQTVFPASLTETEAEFVCAPAAGKASSRTQRQTVPSRWWPAAGRCSATSGTGRSRSWSSTTTSLSANRPRMPCGDRRTCWNRRMMRSLYGNSWNHRFLESRRRTALRVLQSRGDWPFQPRASPDEAPAPQSRLRGGFSSARAKWTGELTHTRRDGLEILVESRHVLDARTEMASVSSSKPTATSRNGSTPKTRCVGRRRISHTSAG